MSKLSGFLSLSFLFLVPLTSGCSTIGQAKVPSVQQTRVTPHSALAFQADSRIKKTLSQNDQNSLTSAEQKALDYGKAGEEIGWKGEAKGTSGVIIAYQPFRVGEASCRRFEHRLTGVANLEGAKGTACKRIDNSWRLVE